MSRHLEHWCPWLAAAAILVYLAVALRVILAKPLWNDEIFTIYLCRLPSLAAVWHALATGLEQMPPLADVVCRAAYSLAGGRDFAIRLPATIGFGAMCVCVYLFLARRLPQPYALIGMVIPFLTGALHFGYEGRSYGVVLGCAGAAMVAWQAVEGRFRALALAGLALSCATAISSHYYAIVILIPLGLGEIVRTIHRRKPDPLLWAALAASLVPLVFFLPLMRAARTYSKVFWARPQVNSVNEAYQSLTYVITPVLIGFVLFWLAFLVYARPRTTAFDLAEIAPDAAVAAGFLALPFVVVGLSLITGAFAPRYAVWGVIGLALCVAYGSFLSTSGSKIFGTLAAGYLLAAFVFTQMLVLRKVPDLAAHLPALEPLERLSDMGLPVVYADPSRYLVAAYYAPPALNNNLFYISDPAAALRYAGTDSPDRALLLLSRIAPLQVTSVHNFTAAHSHFLLVESGEFSWLPPELAIRRATVILRQASPDSKTYEVLVGRADNAISTVSPTPGQGAQALR